MSERDGGSPKENGARVQMFPDQTADEQDTVPKTQQDRSVQGPSIDHLNTLLPPVFLRRQTVGWLVTHQQCIEDSTGDESGGGGGQCFDNQ